MTTYRGKIEAGKIVLRDMPKLPEGTEVEVTLTAIDQPAAPPSSPADDPVFHIADRAVSIGITDMSVETDHYVYGTPKRADQSRK